MKRIPFLLTGLILLAVLLAASGGAPAQAENPPGIPRHRTGHRAKTESLDMLVSQSDGGDPLAGNYRLVEDDEILLASNLAAGTTVQYQAYDVSSNLGTLTHIDGGFDTGTQASVATGDFNNDALDDFAVAWLSGDEIELAIGYYKDGLNPISFSIDTGEKAYIFAPPVATGDFDGDGEDEIVIAWLGGGEWANLKIYDPQGVIQPPTARGKIYDEKIANGNLDVAAGDLDGDGNDEVILAWTDLGNWLGVKVYDVDSKGNFTPKKKWNGDGGRSDAVTVGDFNADGVDEIAVVDGNYLRILQSAQDLSELSSKSKEFWPCTTSDEMPGIDVATGDFTSDGADEVISACNGYAISLTAWAVSSSLHLSYKSNWSKSTGNSGAMSVAVGDLNKDLRAEVVAAWSEMADHQSNYAEVFQVATDLGAISSRSQLNLGGALLGTNLAVAVGDLNADSVRVGPPTYYDVEEARQILAVVNEPPKHYDVIDGTTYDVNVTETCANPPCTYARYENSSSQTTEMSLTTTRDWGFSTELEKESFGIDASLKMSYGQNFENTTSSFKQDEFGDLVLAQHDDVIMRTETDFDVWEYPVYSDTLGTLKGYIAVVFPHKIDPNCTSNCEVSHMGPINGTDALSYYTPNHENHNLLSYSPNPPGDIGVDIKSSARDHVSSNPYEFWVEWTDVESDETKKSKQLDVEVGAGVDVYGIKADLSGTYSQGQVSTQNVSFEQTTSIHIAFSSIDQTYAYEVDPYVYWSADGGYLVVDYAARPETVPPPPPPPPTWWQETYAKTDPALNLPWKYDPPTPEYKLFSKEITFSPASPTAGEMVTITARVRDYSLVGVDNVKVRFYRGDPDQGGTQIGADQNIAQLDPLSSQTVTIHFDTSSFGGQTLDIYAVVDPTDSIDEMHEDNNKAYSMLPVKPVESPGGLTNLAIQAEDIGFTPTLLAQGGAVGISANVQAQGATFTWVGVEFWDGHPDSGGQRIGGEMLPMILADQAGLTHFTWDTTSKYGDHDIWVHIYYKSDEEDIYTDNWAHKVINLPPYKLFLPLLVKDS